MVEQLSEDQYDVDLTADTDESSYEMDSVDLFEYIGDEKSPIATLKSLVLSIDWEITDDILEQFMDELLALQEIWGEDKVKQVYIQGLDKIAKYIYKEKANANPNAIKLLLTFYRDLEKIVTTESMDYEEKKHILLEDVKKFEFLKSQIFDESQQDIQKQKAKPADETSEVSETVDILESVIEDKPTVEPVTLQGDKQILRGLKAAVLGIDWEITDQDLNLLAHEVHNLEETFKNSQAKRIFLQGLGALGAYINLKRSNAHAEAFTLIRSFFDGLEKVVVEGLTGVDEKKILLAESEKFNNFKKVIAATIPKSADKIRQEQEAVRESDVTTFDDDATEPAPALSHALNDSHVDKPSIYDRSSKTDETSSQIQSLPDDKEDEEIVGETADIDEETDVLDDQIVSEIDSRLQGFFGTGAEEKAATFVDSETALHGVDVESSADDDSDEEPLPMDDDGLAPALSSVNEDMSGGEDLEALLRSKTGDEEEDDEVTTDVTGVKVESSADDDSDEEPLPMDDDGLAPALSSVDEDMVGGEDLETIFSHEANDEGVNELTQVVLLDGEEAIDEVTTSIIGVDVESPADDDSDEEPLPMIDGEPAPALMGHEDESGFSEEDIGEDHLQEQEADKEIRNNLDEFFNKDEDELSSGVKAYSKTLKEAGKINEKVESPEKVKEKLDSFFAAEASEETNQTSVDNKASLALDTRDERDHMEDVILIPEENEESMEMFHLEEAEVISDDFAVEELFEDVDILEKMEEESTDEDSLGVFDDQELMADESDSSDNFDEVVFELAEEDPDLNEEVVFVEVVDEDDEADFDIDIEGFAGIDDGHDDDTLFFDDIEEEESSDSDADIDISVPGGEEEVELFDVQLDDEEDIEIDLFDEAEDSSKGKPPVGEIISAEQEQRTAPVREVSLDNLQECIASIGIEDTVATLRELLKEINRLTLELKGHPVEKSFLHLISTIVQHIKQSQQGVRSSAITLLQSISDKLDYVIHTTMTAAQVQEALLNETSKVLLWQQTMLDAHSVHEVDEQIFPDLESIEDKTADLDESFFIEEDSKEEDEDDDILVGDKEIKVSSNINKEINALKDDLQSEMEGLRGDLKKS